MSSFLADVRYALRGLARTPGFTAAAVVTLALGIGATTAIFSLVNGVLLRPLPYADPDRLVQVWEWKLDRADRRNVVNPGNFLDWRERSTVFADVAASTWVGMNLTGDGHPERVEGRAVTVNFFDVLGVPPALGRTFTAADGDKGAATVVILSDALWRRRFGGDPAVVGRAIGISGGTALVAGVMPPSFRPLEREEYWEPFPIGPEARERTSGRYTEVIARLRPGVTVDQAQAELSAIARSLADERPDFNAGWGVNVVPLAADIVGGARRTLWLLLGAVGCVLLIACANVANLLLARAVVRRRESAVRVALGASHGRLLRQWLGEGLVLGLIGGVAGVVLAAWGLRALAALGDQVPRIDEVTIDGRVLVVALGLSLLTSLCFGLAPALATWRADLQPALKGGAPGTGGGGGAGRVRIALIVAQTALAMTLLVGAGLMVRSIVRLRAMDPGFDPANLTTVRIALPRAKYEDLGRQAAFFEEILARVRRAPGVDHASAISWLPFSGMGAGTRFWAEDRPRPPAGQDPSATIRNVDTEFFRTMRIPVLEGRVFEPGDRAGTRPVVVVSEALARLLWPGESAIGKRLGISWTEPNTGLEIVGVVGDTRQRELSDEIRPTIYYHHAQNPFSAMTVVVRSSRTPADVAALVRAEVHALDPEQPVQEARVMEELITESMSDRRFLMFLLQLLSGLAVTLAAVGIYGVLAFTVRQREREIGIRMALGAGRNAVVRLVVGSGLAWAAIGIVVGIAGALAATRLMRSALYEVPPTDLTTYAAVVAALLAVAAAAGYLPARRATRVDPITTLRTE